MNAPRLQRCLIGIALLPMATYLPAQQLPAAEKPPASVKPTADLPAPPSPAQKHPAAIPLATARAEDSYAIYSLLLNEQPFDALPSNQTARLAIADTTVSIREMNPAIMPDSALQPPEENANAFKEAVRDFQSRRFERVQLSRHFALGEDYMLLSGAQVDDFRNARAGSSPGNDLEQQYAGYPGITFFTQVYFDARRTAALVYRNNWCATPCANGQWFYLEKRGTAWVRRSGTVPHP